MKTKQKQVADRLRRRRAAQLKQQAREREYLISGLKNQVDTAHDMNVRLREQNKVQSEAISAGIAEQARLSRSIASLNGELEALKIEHTNLNGFYREATHISTEQSHHIDVLTDTISRLEKELDEMREQLEKKLPAVARIRMHGVDIDISSRDEQP